MAVAATAAKGIAGPEGMREDAELTPVAFARCVKERQNGLHRNSCITHGTL